MGDGKNTTIEKNIKREESWISKNLVALLGVLVPLMIGIFSLVEFILPFRVQQRATQTAVVRTQTAESSQSAMVLSQSHTPSNTPISRTPTSSATSTQTHTPITTPTPEPANIPGFALVQGLRVRSGPGTGFPHLSSFEQMESFVAIGRSMDSGWYVVRFKKPGIDNFLVGWVIARSSQLEGDPALLPQIPSPPTPTPAPIFFITFRNACPNKVTVSYDVLGDQTRFDLSATRTNQQSLGYGPYLFFVNHGDGEDAFTYRELVTITQTAEIFIGCSGLIITFP